MTSQDPQLGRHRWTFLTNHGHVLVALMHDPDLRQRDIAHAIGITEGAVQRIVHDLTRGGYLEVRRVGRRNHYEIRSEKGLPHPVEAAHTLGELLQPAVHSGPTPPPR